MQNTTTPGRRALWALAAALVAGGAFAAQAGAHAHVYPEAIGSEHEEVLTLVVPTEGASSTKSVELTVPEGFTIGSFEPTPGIKRDVVATGEGEDAVISKITWTGFDVPEGEAVYLTFSGSADKEGDYAFKVRQEYANGEVADWSGSEDSDDPAPVVAVGEGAGHEDDDDHGDMLAIIALAVGGLALLLGLVGVARRGGRELT